MPTDASLFAWLPALRAALALFFQLAPAGLALFTADRLIRHALAPSPMRERLVRQLFPWTLGLEILRLAVIVLCLYFRSPAGTQAAGQAVAAPLLADPLLAAAPALLSFILLFPAVLFAPRARKCAALAAALSCLANLLFLFLLAGAFRQNLSVWPPFAGLILLSPAAGLCLAGPRILLRRARDDFGRDYYAFALRACAGQAGLSALASGVFAAAAAAFAFTAPPSSGVWTAAAAPVLLLAAAALWLLIRRSAMPMRRKTSLFLTPALIIAALFCLCAAFSAHFTPL